MSINTVREDKILFKLPNSQAHYFKPKETYIIHMKYELI